MLLPQLKNMTQQKSSSSGRSLHNFSTLFIDNETILFYIIRYQKKYFCFMFANTRHVGDIGSLKYATTTSKNTDPLVFKITKKLRLMKLLYLISSLLRTLLFMKHGALEVLSCTYWLCFFLRCQCSIWPICVVLALCPQPKTLILDGYAELFGNFFLIKDFVGKIRGKFKIVL